MNPWPKTYSRVGLREEGVAIEQGVNAETYSTVGRSHLRSGEIKSPPKTPSKIWEKYIKGATALARSFSGPPLAEITE